MRWPIEKLVIRPLRSSAQRLPLVLFVFVNGFLTVAILAGIAMLSNTPFWGSYIRLRALPRSSSLWVSSLNRFSFSSSKWRSRC